METIRVRLCLLEDEYCLHLFYLYLAKTAWLAILGIEEDFWHAVANFADLFLEIIECFR